jgi:hypothetical protein
MLISAGNGCNRGNSHRGQITERLHKGAFPEVQNSKPYVLVVNFQFSAPSLL